MNCKQDGCSEPAAYRFTWAGSDESVICEAHVGKLRAISNAMGYYVQIIPLEPKPSDTGSVADGE